MYRSSEEYEEIVKDIIDIYLDYGIKDFPINEKDICNKLGVSLVPYSALSDEVIKLLKRKRKYGFFVKGCRNFPPTIYYNDSIESDGTRRITIFHELKHYVYNEDSDDEDEDDLAEFFARYFMCPIPYLIIKGLDDVNEIISHCDVNAIIAGNVISNLHNRKEKHGYRIFEHEIPFLKHLDIDAYEVFKRSHSGGDDN